MNWNNLKIGRQITIGFSVCILMAATLAALGYFALNKQTQTFETLNEAYWFQIQIERVKSADKK